MQAFRLDLDVNFFITRLPTHLSYRVVWAVLLVLAPACARDDTPSKNPPKSVAESRVPDPSPAQKPDPKPKGELHLRIDRGVVMRTGPDPSSSVVRIAERSQVLRVLEKRKGSYHVAFDGGRAWVQGGPKARELRIMATRSPPQPSVTADAKALALARRHLSGGGRELTCGPYTLLTDVRSSPVLEACGRLVSDLDRAYTRRYGVKPVGKSRETLILFRGREAFRAFAATDGPNATGYAGHARGADGYLVLYAGDQPAERVVQTLIHEITHLLNRRALGAPLPRWLSEGLADGLGDPASLTGLGSSQGLKGAEAVARRVLEVDTLPNLRRVVGLDNRAFDRDPKARDYEQGAVFVRYLMSDPKRKRSFQAYLKGIAEGESDGPEALAAQLGLPGDDWNALDRKVRTWLRTTLSGNS